MIFKFLLVASSLITTISSIGELQNLYYSMPANTFASLIQKSYNNGEENIYDYKNKQNLAKVIQNILLLHLKHNPKEVTMDNLCNFTSCENIIETPTTTIILPTLSDSIATTTTTTSIFNATQTEIETIRNMVKNEILLKLKAKTLSFANGAESSDRIYVYFIISIIFLSLLVLLLIIILSVCCVIYYKQKARLDYYLNENYFTYFNNKQPPTRGPSSFTLTETTPDLFANSKNLEDSKPNKISPILGKNKIIDRLPISEEKLVKISNLKTNLQPLKEIIQDECKVKNEPVKFLKAKKSSFRIMNKCKANFINLDGLDEKQQQQKQQSGFNSKTIINVVPEPKQNSDDDDDDDVILEGDLNIINNLTMFSSQHSGITKLMIDDRLCKDFKMNESLTSMTAESGVSDICTSSTLTNNNNNNNSTTTNQNTNQVVASPAVMRDRYYKLLREQVFPYLHRPIPPVVKPKQHDHFVNDVLY
jgi:hypothetical protein